MRVRSRFLVVLAILLIMLDTEGCATKFAFGALPRTEALGSLRLGASTQDDVLKVLGRPPGKGVIRVQPDLKARSVWAYEYIEAEGMETRQKLLLVYFDGDVFDGYLWVSSLQTMEQIRK
jgi:hypothetical protein